MSSAVAARPLPSDPRARWLAQQTRQLLSRDDLGHTSRCDYDMAWVARVPDASGKSPAFPDVANALRRLQQANGGIGEPRHPSGRAIATLVAALAMTDFDPEPQDDARIAAALAFVRRTWPLACTHPEPTIAFELLAPALLREAATRGMDVAGLRESSSGIGDARLARVRDHVYEPRASVGFSLEFMGDRLDLQRAPSVLLDGGTVSGSIAATAYYARATADPRALGYLRGLVDRVGADTIPYGADANLWGTTWTLHHLALGGLLASGAAPHLQRLQDALAPHGLGWSSLAPYGDGDDTALGLCVLADHGAADLPWGTMAQYEQADFFITHLGETTPSTSVNAHVLTAAQRHPGALAREATMKVRHFLRSSQHADGQWADKWHVSPLYPTSRAVAALLPCDPGAAARGLRWIESAQRTDGSWGTGDQGTAEETAYAIHALAAAAEAGLDIARPQIDAGCRFLASAYPSVAAGTAERLWVAKDLYCPTVVVQSAVLAALAQGQAAGCPWEIGSV